VVSGECVKTMKRELDRVDRTAAFLRDRIGATPDVAIVLGSGLGGYASRPAGAVSLDYEAIPDWPPASILGHEGRIVVGEVAGRRAAVLSGRSHLYEGLPIEAVVFGVRVLVRCGVRIIILTNAAGGINTTFAPGTLMVIEDHLNLTGRNPLVGPNDDRLGVRFPDMTEAYSRRLRSVADQAAATCGVPVVHGVYAGVLGPSYETPAEIRLLRAGGADAVGMSTVFEAIAARHMGAEVMGLSCVTNMAAGVLPEPLSHEVVYETARRSGADVTRLLDAIVARL